MAYTSSDTGQGTKTQPAVMGVGWGMGVGAPQGTPQPSSPGKALNSACAHGVIHPWKPERGEGEVPAGPCSLRPDRLAL